MKSTIIAIIVAIVFIGGAIMLAGGGAGYVGAPQDQNNVTIVDGKQYIDITAKGGFSPRRSAAKAGVPTILKVSTNGTFDCSSSVRIPSLKIYKTLTSTGVSEFDLGIPQAGVLRGSCGMGMYPFEIDFQV